MCCCGVSALESTLQWKLSVIKVKLELDTSFRHLHRNGFSRPTAVMLLHKEMPTHRSQLVYNSHTAKKMSKLVDPRNHKCRGAFAVHEIVAIPLAHS